MEMVFLPGYLIDVLNDSGENFVSILVLMEMVFLHNEGERKSYELESFNPCFDGNGLLA